jgi:hypothetical protein
LTLPVTSWTFRPLPDSYRKLGSLLGAATAALGLLGLLGWVLGMPLLSSIRSSYIPMAPLTSIAFLCLGGLLLVHSMGRTSGSGAGEPRYMNGRQLFVAVPAGFEPAFSP